MYQEKYLKFKEIYSRLTNSQGLGTPISFDEFKEHGVIFDESFLDWIEKNVDKYSYTLVTMPTWAYKGN